MLINFILALRVGDYSRLGVYSNKFQTCIQLSKKWSVNGRYWNRIELWVQSMSDNAPAKVVTVWPWHYDEPALYIYAKSMRIVINYLRCLKPTVPCGSSIDY